MLRFFQLMNMLCPQDCGFCASNVCLPVGEACLETVQVSWKEGLIDTVPHWKAGSCSSGQGHVSGAHRGSFGFRKSLGCLSVDGKGCVPVCCFGLRHHSTEACGLLGKARSWDQNISWKTHANECSWYIYHQCLYLCGGPQLLPSSPGDQTSR